MFDSFSFPPAIGGDILNLCKQKRLSKESRYPYLEMFRLRRFVVDWHGAREEERMGRGEQDKFSTTAGKFLLTGHHTARTRSLIFGPARTGTPVRRAPGSGDGTGTPALGTAPSSDRPRRCDADFRHNWECLTIVLQIDSPELKNSTVTKSRPPERRCFVFVSGVSIVFSLL